MGLVKTWLHRRGIQYDSPIYNYLLSNTKFESIIVPTQRQLRYFVAVGQELHFGRAALKLSISQPPLSQQIMALEDEIGVQLLRRLGRRVELTPAGLVLLTHARDVLARTTDAVRATQLANSGVIGRLSIGFIHAATFVLLPDILARFRIVAPQAELVLSEMTSNAQVDSIADGRVDVGLLRPPVSNAAVLTQTLAIEPLVAAVPSGHYLARKSKVDLAAMADKPMVIFTPHRSPLYGQVLSACMSAGFQPRVVQEATHIMTVIGLVRAGLGIALLPQSASQVQMPGVRYMPMRYDGPRAETVLGWRVGPEIPLVRAFLGAAIPQRPARRPSVTPP